MAEMLGVTAHRNFRDTGKTLLEFDPDIWDKYGMVIITPNRLTGVTYNNGLISLEYNGCTIWFAIDVTAYEEHEFHELVDWIWSQV